jgi:membrane protein insertase Oxa1/YidC/SpoIIIJ
MSDEEIILDMLLSIGCGLSLGWFVGGLWNMLQGRTWNGHYVKKGP